MWTKQILTQCKTPVFFVSFWQLLCLVGSQVGPRMSGAGGGRNDAMWLLRRAQRPSCESARVAGGALESQHPQSQNTKHIKHITHPDMFHDGLRRSSKIPYDLEGLRWIHSAFGSHEINLTSWNSRGFWIHGFDATNGPTHGPRTETLANCWAVPRILVSTLVGNKPRQYFQRKRLCAISLSSYKAELKNDKTDKWLMAPFIIFSKPCNPLRPENRCRCDPCPFVVSEIGHRTIP